MQKVGARPALTSVPVSGFPPHRSRRQSFHLSSSAVPGGDDLILTAPWAIIFLALIVAIFLGFVFRNNLVPQRKLNVDVLEGG